jgi:rhodanese-related sulfurtransferase
MKTKCILLLIAGLVIGVVTMGLIIDDEHFVSTDEMVELAMEECDALNAEGLAELMMGEEIYTLIDVRQKVEHYYGYIPGSVILPRGSMEFNIGSEKFWESEGIYKPMKDEVIVVYCKKGSRGALAAHSLKHMGYSKVYYLEGGFKKWELAYPDYVEKNLNALGGGHEEEDTGGC